MPFVVPRLILDGRAAYAFVDDVSVVVSDVPRWTDPDVDRYLSEMTALAGRVTAKAALMHFRGDTFGARHRGQIVQWLEREGLTADTRACILSDSAVMRGAMTAYAWITRAETAAFDPHELSAACAWTTRDASASSDAVARAYQECRSLLTRRDRRAATG